MGLEKHFEGAAASIRTGAVCALLLIGSAALAQQPDAGVQPSAPTGSGPTEAQPAPSPPPEQNLILPNASGHINSAAPTMHRNCETAQASRPGTAAPDGRDDPCLRDPTPGDRATAPPPSRN